MESITYTTKELADILCVSVDTLRTWRTKSNRTQVFLFGTRNGNEYTYTNEEVRAFLDKYPQYHRGLCLFLYTPIKQLDHLTRRKHNDTSN